jgi:hypothetical protein
MTMRSPGEFPLSNSSRRRRRVVSKSRAADCPPAAEGRRESQLRPDRLNVWTSSQSGDIRIDAPALHSGLWTILASRRPLAWMLAGDNYCGLDEGSPGFCQRFTAELARDRGSPSDPVINVAWPGCLLADIRTHLDDWLRHAPDVLLILSGPADADGGVDCLSRFEEDANSILGTCREASVLPVLTTAPLPLASETDADYVDPLVYAEAIRALSAEWDVPLIDFREEWERLAIRTGLAGSWVDENELRPSAIGLMRLVDQLMHEIRRHRDVQPAEQPVTLQVST